jgi:hypothetical protein
MQYDVRAELKEALGYLAFLRRDQIPFATAYALTKTAEAAKVDVEREIVKVFDAPTPYTQRAVFIRPAQKNRLVAQVKLKDQSVKGIPAVRYLIHHIEGTQRQRKGFEEQLIRNGVMPPNMYAIPTKNAPMDRYGNVPRGIINRILSQLQAQRDSTANESAESKRRYLARRRKRNERYFVAYPGRAKTAHLTPGIWERVEFGFGGSIRPVFVFTNTAPKYSKRFRFYETVERSIAQNLRAKFEEGFRVADRTKR